MSDKIPSWIPGGAFVLGDVKMRGGFVPPSASLNPPDPLLTGDGEPEETND